MTTETLSRDTDLFVHTRLTDQQLRQYHDQGYLALGRVLTDAGLERMR